MTRFVACLPVTLGFEGLWSNNPNDPGGATMKGVTQKTYNAFRKNKGLPARSVRNIEDAELNEIYKSEYWDKVSGDSLPVGLDLAVFDFAVNSGPAKAAKVLQGVLGVDADGSIGAKTLAALPKDPGALSKLIETYCDRRLDFMRSLKGWATFGTGWTRRVEGNTDGAQPSDIGIVDYATLAVAQVFPTPPVAIGTRDGEVAAKANPSNVSVARSAPGIGAIAVAAGAGGQAVLQVAQTVQPHIGGDIFGFIALAVFLLLSLAGGALLVFSWYRKFKDAGLSFKELFQ